MVICKNEREILRANVQFFIKKNPTAKKSKIVNYFKQIGYARKTVYNVIDKLAATQSLQDRKRTGRKSNWTSARTKKLDRLTNNQKGVSTRKLARIFEVSQTNIVEQLAKMGLKHHKRQKIPNYDQQTPEKTKRYLKRVKKCSKELANQIDLSNFKVVMDDEKYFRFSGDRMPGNDGYYTRDKNTCPDDVRFIGEDKFPKQMLVWIAISEDGASKPVIRPVRAEAINQNIYINECLSKRLLPFIRNNYPRNNYIFWPDLASSHYAKATVAWMSTNVNFVDKEINPPKVPQARPIENFWGCLAQKVYEGGWVARNQTELAMRIEQKIKTFDQPFFQRLMEGVTEKLRNIANKGVLHYLK
jgi:hypothetical protein